MLLDNIAQTRTTYITNNIIDLYVTVERNFGTKDL